MTVKLLKHIVFLFCLTAFLLLSSSVYSQYKFTPDPFGHNSPQFSPFENYIDIDYNHPYLSLNSELTGNSNGLTNDFINQFYLGHFLDTDLKTNNLNRLQTQNNLLGYNWITELKVNIPSKHRGLSYFAAFEDHNYYDIYYDKDLYRLVFFGNRDFAGQFMTLGNQSFTIMKFQQIKAGVVKTWFGKSHVNVFSAGLGINNGQTFLNYDIPKATFFTQSNAEYISMDLQMNMHRSDTVSSKFGAENGLGMSLDLSFYHRDAHNSFEIKLQNLGFITWNKHSQYYDKDTSIRFEGVNISNIFNLDAENIHLLTGDSLNNEFVHSDKTARFTNRIPMRGSINYTRYLWHNRLSLSFSLVNYYYLHFNPLICFEPSYKIKIKRSAINISPNVKYGGYGNLNYGLGISASVNSKFYIELRTDYLNGYMDPKNSSGLGGYVSIIKTL